MSKDREIDENSYKLKNYRSEFDLIVLNTEENLHILGRGKKKKKRLFCSWEGYPFFDP